MDTCNGYVLHIHVMDKVKLKLRQTCCQRDMSEVCTSALCAVQYLAHYFQDNYVYSTLFN